MSDTGQKVKQLALGDELHGFVVQSVEQLEDYHGTGYSLRHRSTGMEVYYIENSDDEAVFGYLFKTPPINDSGAPHIIEHAVLAGSEEFPVKDPFMMLLKGSVNTFMNAMTYPDYTVYPAASVLPQDFFNLFRVYSDAVFNPLLRKETFWQEGVRLVVDDDRNLTFDGVVFNEMKGEFSDHDSIVARQSIRLLYPDTPYFFESGGDPKEIIKLDYRQFSSYYATYYHPSNCRLFVYGKTDLAAMLSLVENRYLQGYTKISPAGPSALAKEWVKPKTATVYSMGDSESQSSKASVTLSWATTQVEDSIEVLTLSILTDILLGNPGAPLYKAIIESKLGKDISDVSGMDTSFRQMPFVVGFKGIAPEAAAQAEQLILDTLSELVTKGLDPKLVANAVKRYEFGVRELSGNIPIGLRALIRSSYAWLQGFGAEQTLKISEPLAELKRQLAQERQDKGYFEEWIQRNLLDNKHRCLLTVIPDVSFLEQQERSIDEHLGSVVAKLEEDGLAEIAENTNRFVEFELQRDSEEALASIPLLTRDDLPAEINILEQTETSIHGVKTLVQRMETNGIAYIDGAFNLSDLTEEEHLLVPLLTRMLHMSGIGETPYDQVALRIRELTGGLFFALESGTMLHNANESFSALVFRMKCLVEDAQKAAQLTGEVLAGANLRDGERLIATVNDLISSYEANIISAGQLYATQRANAIFSPVMRQNERWNGISQWLILSSYNLENPRFVAELGEKLEALRARIIAKNRLQLHLCVSDDAVGESERALSILVETLPALSPIMADRAIGELFMQPSGEQVELFKLPATVAYNALAVRSADPFEVEQAHQALLGQIVMTNHLWERVRQIGGAYSVGAANDLLERLFTFFSYRDPRVEGTLNDFKGSLEEIAQKSIDGGMLEQAVISIVGQDLRPLYPQRASLVAFRRALYGIDDAYRAQRRSWLLEATPQDIQRAAGSLLQSLESASSIVVLAGQAILERDALTAERLRGSAVQLPL